MYAIVQTGGKQYKVAKGEKLLVEKLEAKEGSQLQLNTVCALDDGKGLKLGKPTIAGAAVKAKVVKQMRDDKILVFKKKRRQGYCRTQGHRQHMTLLSIEDIIESGAKPEAQKKA